jgi:hypothetical protein
MSPQLSSLERSLHADALKQLGDVSVAAKILDVSESYLNKARMAGTGPRYIKLGASVKYILPELLPWALARARTSTSEPDKAA